MAESGCLHTSSLNTVNADNRVICNNFKGESIVVPQSSPLIVDVTEYENNGIEGDILSLNDKTGVINTAGQHSVSIKWPRGTYIQDMSFMIVDESSESIGENKITLLHNGTDVDEALYIKLDAVKGVSEGGIMSNKIIAANSGDTEYVGGIKLFKNIPINFIQFSTGILGENEGGIIEQMSAGIEHDTDNYNHSFNIMNSESVSSWTHDTTMGYPLYNPSDGNSREYVKVTFTKANVGSPEAPIPFTESNLKIMVICTFIKIDLVEIEDH